MFNKENGLGVCEAAVRKYFNWLSEELSNIGRVAWSDVYKKIGSLIEEIIQELDNNTPTL